MPRARSSLSYLVPSHELVGPRHIQVAEREAQATHLRSPVPTLDSRFIYHAHTQPDSPWIELARSRVDLALVHIT
jgi:hypothetical protein